MRMLVAVPSKRTRLKKLPKTRSSKAYWRAVRSGSSDDEESGGGGGGGQSEHDERGDCQEEDAGYV